MAKIRDFKNYVGSCGLQDLDSTGAYYTWNNKQPGENRVYSKIDRVLVNEDRRSMLPASKVH